MTAMTATDAAIADYLAKHTDIAERDGDLRTVRHACATMWQYIEERIRESELPRVVRAFVDLGRGAEQRCG